MKNLHQKKAKQFALEDIIQGNVIPIFVVFHTAFRYACLLTIYWALRNFIHGC